MTRFREHQAKMADVPSEECDMQMNGVSEVMDLLHIDVETDVVDNKPGREDTMCSVSAFDKLSH